MKAHQNFLDIVCARTGVVIGIILYCLENNYRITYPCNKNLSSSKLTTQVFIKKKMLYQNIKNIINKVNMRIPILTANLFKNYAAVWKELKCLTVRIYLTFFKVVKNKTIFASAAIASPVESTGLWNKTCSWVTTHPWETLGIVVSIVIVGSVSYYYIAPLIYGAGAAAGSSGKPDTKPSSGGGAEVAQKDIDQARTLLNSNSTGATVEIPVDSIQYWENLSVADSGRPREFVVQTMEDIIVFFTYN